MKNKYRAIKRFIKSSKQLIKDINRGKFNNESAAEIKGNLKLLDEYDYKKFSKLIEQSSDHCINQEIKLFLIEKMASYKNYDFWPQDERVKQAGYKRERNKILLEILNKIIDLLIHLRNKFFP